MALFVPNDLSTVRSDPVHRPHPYARTCRPLTSSSVEPFAFAPLPLGAIQPRSWLRDQLRLSADGLVGHERDFYDLVADSPWLGGGAEYSPLNEAFPYWFNGLVSLAYGLDDARLQKQVRDAAAHVLRRRRDRRGWIGPERDYDSNALWGRFPLALGLMQLAEAEPGLRGKIVRSLHEFLPLMWDLLQDGRSDAEVWGRARCADMIIVLQWLYAHHPRDNAQLLLATMERLQDHGADWEQYLSEEEFPFDDIDRMPSSVSDPLFPFLHGVNAAQGLKAPGVTYRRTGSRASLAAALRGVNYTLTYHGAAHGGLIGDERLAGLSPNRGTELCSVVELLYTLTHLHAISGAPQLADAAERAAFNALPAMLAPDHWTHQYIALANQPWAAPVAGARDGLWWNVGPEAAVFGVAPNYPCCAVNFPQGWPKLLAAAFTTLPEGKGVAHSVLVPARVETVLAGGTRVVVECNTTYPFGRTFTYTSNASAPFFLAVRLPGWHAPTFPLATISLPSRPYLGGALDRTTRMSYYALPAGVSTLRLTLQAPSVRIEARPNATVAVFRGPLLYALDVGEQAHSVPASVAGAPREAHSVHYRNTKPWDVAIDPMTLAWHGEDDGAEGGAEGGEGEQELPAMVWAYHAPKGYITARGCRIHWPVWRGVPAPVPLEGERRCQEESFEVVLRPFGSLRCRMAELPVVDLSGGELGAGPDREDAAGPGGALEL